MEAAADLAAVDGVEAAARVAAWPASRSPELKCPGRRSDDPDRKVGPSRGHRLP